MSQTQTQVELPNDLLRRLEERAARGGVSPSVLICRAIGIYLHDEERERISREIIEGYERIPPTDEEMAIAEASTREAVEEEPW